MGTERALWVDRLTGIALHYGYRATTAPHVSVRYILARRFGSRPNTDLVETSRQEVTAYAFFLLKLMCLACKL